jgi:phage terminase large subunit GpA-like protein
MKQAPDAIRKVFAALSRECLPPPAVDCIQWLENVRWLSPESSKEIGPFRFGRAQYLIEPMRAIVDPDCPEVILDWASQCGKSELILNGLLYWAHHSPAPCLIVTPDWSSSKSLSRDRVGPMMRDARVYSDNGAKDGGAELLQQRGPGATESVFRMLLAGRMPCTVVPASSASSLAQRPIKYLVCDEVSRFPLEARGRTKEGDPLQLSRIRLSTFGDSSKAIFVSSPVEQGACRISELYGTSSRERYHSKCPLCGYLQVLKLPEMDFEDATCKCLGCGQSHNQDAWQSEPGAWIAENPKCARRGFWLNAFVSPFIRWEAIFAEWRLAVHRQQEGDTSLLKVAMQTRLAENFAATTERMSAPEILMSRREHYPFEVPDEARIIVASVDVHRTWFEYLVCAAGPRGETWFLECGQINGRIESDAPEMFEELDRRVFQRKWLRPDGRAMSVARCLMDSGYSTALVYRFCRQYARVLIAYRGSHDISGVWRRGTDQTAHARLVQGNSNLLKDVLAARLSIETPGPGFLHFSAAPDAGFDAEFFEQLLSERRERRKRQGMIVTTWVQVRERNEALDLCCLCICAVETYSGALDTMEPQIVTTDKEQAQSAVKFGAQKMVVGSDLGIGGVTGFGAEPSDRPRRTGWGPLPGSGVSF